MHKTPYIKPQVIVFELKQNGLICTSPQMFYYQGGGGTYNEDSIWNNGDDY